MGAWYDKTKNAFIWNAIERRELVVYEYRINDYINYIINLHKKTIIFVPKK